MQFKVLTLDGDEVMVNTDQFAIIKYHPSIKNQKAGILITSSNREIVVELESFRFLWEQMHNQPVTFPQKEK